MVHHIQPYRLRRPRTHHHANPQQACQQIRHPPPFYETENHAPHAPQSKPVEKHGKHVPRHRQHGKKYQRHLRNPHREQNKPQTGFPPQLGNDFYTREFCQKIPQNLDHRNGNLIIHPAHRQTIEFRGSKRLPQGIHQRIGKQGSTARPQNKKNIRE